MAHFYGTLRENEPLTTDSDERSDPPPTAAPPGNPDHGRVAAAAPAEPPGPVSVSRVAAVWWPLALSWLIMGVELPLVSAIMARLPDPEIHLAAYGGVVFPLSLLIEAPIIMLLAASTAMCRDWPSYRLVHRFMMTTSAALTLIHALVAFTPLFDVIVGGIMGAPAEIHEPARIGLMIMTPWTWAIAYRRFQQGNLIRAGNTGIVVWGTLVRLLANVVVLAAGYRFGALPGIVVATVAVAAGVVFEALFAGVAVRPVLRRLKEAAIVEPALSLGKFLSFYVPLALTSLLTLLSMPIASSAMSRMPNPIDSLAAWPVVNGLVFTLRSVGFAFNEVVVSMLEIPGSLGPLRSFAIRLASTTSALILALALSPLSRIWFGDVSALSPPLVALATTALMLAFLMPAMSVIQSWYQGAIVHSHRTRGITEAVVVFLVSITALLGAGIVFGRVSGIYVAITGVTLASIAQNLWLRRRALDAIRAVAQRDRRLEASRFDD